MFWFGAFCFGYSPYQRKISLLPWEARNAGALGHERSHADLDQYQNIISPA